MTTRIATIITPAMRRAMTHPQLTAVALGLEASHAAVLAERGIAPARVTAEHGAAGPAVAARCECGTLCRAGSDCACGCSVPAPGGRTLSLERSASTPSTRRPRVRLAPGAEPVLAPSPDDPLQQIAGWLQEHCRVDGESGEALVARAKRVRDALTRALGMSEPPLLASAHAGRNQTERVLAAMRSRDRSLPHSLETVTIASGVAHSSGACV